MTDELIANTPLDKYRLKLNDVRMCSLKHKETNAFHSLYCFTDQLIHENEPHVCVVIETGTALYRH